MSLEKEETTLFDFVVIGRLRKGDIEENMKGYI